MRKRKQDSLKIEYVEVDKLIPYVNNPKKHPEEQVNLIASSIKEFGFINPIIVDKDNEIIAGHGRLLACKRLGIKKVPVIRVEHLTPAQIKAYRIADNRLTELGEWDTDLLRIELEELQELDFDIELTGFSFNDLEELLESSYEDIEDNESIYTWKVDSIYYEPTMESPPPIETCLNTEKADYLKEKIEKANIPDDIKDFLIKATTRFYEFNYKNIAELYAHSPPEVQRLMEELALVIIDFGEAVRLGFIKMDKEIRELYEKYRRKKKYEE